MAPIRTRATRRRTLRAISKLKSNPASTQDSSNHNPAASTSSTSTGTKKSKRLDRHNALLAKVQQSRVSKPKARRRPGKKLSTGLGELAGALPELDEDEDGDEEQNEEWEGFSDDEGEGKGDQNIAGTKRRKKPASSQQGAKMKMKMKTLKSRPGAQKRKQLLEHREAERMGKNMAQLLAPSFSAAQATAALIEKEAGGNEKDRWAALRGFIGGTMEQSALFKYSGGKG